MKVLPVVLLGAVLVSGGVALADNQVITGPATANLSLFAACGTGFAKGGAYGTPTGDHGWTCSTPTLACPAPPAGMSGGTLGPKAVTLPSGVQFSYGCSYRQLPK